MIGRALKIVVAVTNGGLRAAGYLAGIAEPGPCLHKRARW